MMMLTVLNIFNTYSMSFLSYNHLRCVDHFLILYVVCVSIAFCFSLQKLANEKCRKLSKRVSFYTVDCRDSCGEIFVDLKDYCYSKVFLWSSFAWFSILNFYILNFDVFVFLFFLSRKNWRKLLNASYNILVLRYSWAEHNFSFVLAILDFVSYYQPFMYLLELNLLNTILMKNYKVLVLHYFS